MNVIVWYGTLVTRIMSHEIIMGSHKKKNEYTSGNFYLSFINYNYPINKAWSEKRFVRATIFEWRHGTLRDKNICIDKDSKELKREREREWDHWDMRNENEHADVKEWMRQWENETIGFYVDAYSIGTTAPCLSTSFRFCYVTKSIWIVSDTLFHFRIL